METTFGEIGFNQGAEDIGAGTEPVVINVWEKLLKSPTGEGDITQYLEHPLNYHESVAMAKIIRGMTGLLGNLNLAIVDIFVGLLQYLFERRTVDQGDLPQ